MTSIIIPNMFDKQETERCQFCDSEILYLAVYRIKAFDAKTGRSFATRMDLSVCDHHAEKLSFEISKSLEIPLNLIVL